jgi:hypothetical protein
VNELKNRKACPYYRLGLWGEFVDLKKGKATDCVDRAENGHIE